MTYYKMSDYTLKGYVRGPPGKKYSAILKNKKNGRIVKVHFGDSTAKGHYKDTTGRGLWSHKDHNDEKLRKAFRARHKGFLRSGYYSPGWFSLNKLW